MTTDQIFDTLDMVEAERVNILERFNAGNDTFLDAIKARTISAIANQWKECKLSIDAYENATGTRKTNLEGSLSRKIDTLVDALTLWKLGMENDTPTDTELLDWLERQGRLYDWQLSTERDNGMVRNCVFLDRNCSSGYATARAAIAAAMQREEDRTRKAKKC